MLTRNHSKMDAINLPYARGKEIRIITMYH